nr:hypothetical protein CFP56_05265 [Quercus suber]
MILLQSTSPLFFVPLDTSISFLGPLFSVPSTHRVTAKTVLKAIDRLAVTAKYELVGALQFSIHTRISSSQSPFPLNLLSKLVLHPSPDFAVKSTLKGSQGPELKHANLQGTAAKLYDPK